MTKIKLHDRVKLKDGRTGSIVLEIKREGTLYPLLCVTDDDGWLWLNHDDEYVAEIIGHRYFVDTPFTTGETYETKRLGAFKVVGIGLIVTSDAMGGAYPRNADGTDPFSREGDLILPAKPKTRTITVEMTEDEIAQMSGVIPRLKAALGENQ